MSEEAVWIILIGVGIAWWRIGRAMRRAEGRITSRLDKLEELLGRIEPAHRARPQRLQKPGNTA